MVNQIEYKLYHLDMYWWDLGFFSRDDSKIAQLPIILIYHITLIYVLELSTYINVAF